MYLDFIVKIPDLKSGISKKKIKGTTHIYYEHERKYYADRQYTVPQCTSIGKACEDAPDMMVSNGNYLKFFPDAELLDEFRTLFKSGCLRVGVGGKMILPPPEWSFSPAANIVICIN